MPTSDNGQKGGYEIVSHLTANDLTFTNDNGSTVMDPGGKAPSFVSSDLIKFDGTYSWSESSPNSFGPNSIVVAAVFLLEGTYLPAGADLGAVVASIVSFQAEEIGPLAFETFEHSFTPRELPGYKRDTTASRMPNNPLFLYCGFVVMDDSQFGEYSASYRVGQTLSFGQLLLLLPFFSALPCSQDLTDIIRQEYVDASEVYPLPRGRTLPKRSEIILVKDRFNTGNYVDVPYFGSGRLGPSIADKFAAVYAAYRGHTVVQSDGAQYLVNGVPATIDNNAMLELGSAYRNPRRNLAANSKYPFDSYHVWGCAFDITPPKGTSGFAAGQQIPLDLHKHVYPTLVAAAKSVVPEHAGAVITESSANPVPVGDGNENHVHVQWK